MAKRKLPSLSAWNAEAAQMYREIDLRTARSGVGCDKCGQEMVYADRVQITSNPPRRNVRCLGCGFISTKVV